MFQHDFKIEDDWSPGGSLGGGLSRSQVIIHDRLMSDAVLGGDSTPIKSEHSYCSQLSNSPTPPPINGLKDGKFIAVSLCSGSSGMSVCLMRSRIWVRSRATANKFQSIFLWLVAEFRKKKTATFDVFFFLKSATFDVIYSINLDVIISVIVRCYY